MKLLLVCLVYIVLTGFYSEELPLDDGTFDISLLGQDVALCAGQCVDFEIQIDGTHTGTFHVDLLVQGTFGVALDNYSISESVIQICHDPNIGGPFLDDGQIPRIFRIDTGSLPFEIELIGAQTEEAIPCDGIILTGGPFIISDGLANAVFSADIPAHSCDSLVLPEISPALPGVSYYTEPGGAGTQYNPGEVITYLDTQLPNGDILNTLYLSLIHI